VDPYFFPEFFSFFASETAFYSRVIGMLWKRCFRKVLQYHRSFVRRHGQRM